MQDTVVIEGQSAVHRAVQRRIGCGPSRGFLFIRCLTGIGFLFIRCLTGVGFFFDFCMQSRIFRIQGIEPINYGRVQGGKVFAHLAQHRIGTDDFRIQFANVAGVNRNSAGIRRNVGRVGRNSGLVGGDIALISRDIGLVGGDIVRIVFNLVAMRVDQLESLVHIGDRGPIPQGDHIIRSGNSRRIDGRRRGCQRGRHPRTHDNSGCQCGHGGLGIPFACVFRDDDIRMPDFTPNDTVRFVHKTTLLSRH